MILLIALLIVGWIAAAVLGTQAYFRGEQKKPIHDRNWRSESFDHALSSLDGCLSPRQVEFPTSTFG